MMVRITIEAAEKLKQLIAKDNLDIQIPETAGIRFSAKVRSEDKYRSKIQYEYCIAFEVAPKEYDMVIESRGIRIFIDHDSQQHLKGSLIFLLKGYDSEALSVENPNEKSAYSCGQPFKPK